VKELERKLKADPKDLLSRLRLIGHSQSQRPRDLSAQSKGAQAQLLVGLVEHHPKFNLTLDLTRFLQPPSYQEAAEHWLAAAKANSTDAQVVGNAGIFLVSSVFVRQYADKGEAFLQQARKLDPKNPKWPKSLGGKYSFDRRLSASPSAQRASAAKALQYLEEAYGLTDPDVRKRIGEGGDYFLQDLAAAAFEADDRQKAKEYATDLLKNLDAKDKERNWNYGNAIFDANTVLGRVALADGKIDDAKKYLLAAGKTNGSPQLNSFGPGMVLADELLKKGEKEAVLEYFKLCRAFWELGTRQLDDWTKAVEAGKPPNFGPSLRQ
jgi:hypothetical protein